MINAWVERNLRKLLGARAHDPDPTQMTKAERHEAQEANMPSGVVERSPLANDGRGEAPSAAKHVNETAPLDMTSPLADEQHHAKVDARFSNEEDGSYLSDDLADDSHEAEAAAAGSNEQEPPRSTLAGDTKTAKFDAERANEPAPQKGGQGR